jgi:hypothetical protein
VPTTALPTALLFAAWAADAPPVCCDANPRHMASSDWNASKLLPEGGNAMTDGPCGGGTAQALSPTTDTSPMAEIARFMFEVPKIRPDGGLTT